MSIVFELPGFLKVFSDGSVTRQERETSPASEDSSSDGYKSRDVIIDPTKPITGRIFLPDIPAASSCPLPVLVFFHSGGFCVGTTTWVGYHTFLGDLAVASQSIVLSVDYRLAPEHRLPTAYEDCYCSLQWLAKKEISEPWLQRCDISRVFLSGSSSGGNIAHNITIMAIRNGFDEVNIKGLFLIGPYFGSEDRTENGKGSESAQQVAMIDSLWKLSLPEGSNRDYFGCNFEKAELSSEEWQRFPPVMINVGSLDLFRERGVMYARFLEEKGVEVKLVEAEGQRHMYHIVKSEASRLLQKQMSEFIQSF